MDSQFFNRKRFIALCRWDWTERQKALGLQTVVIYAVLTVFSGFYTIRGALRANALSHYVSPQRVEEWKAISGRPRPRRGRKLDFRECPVFPDSCLLPCRHCTPDTKGIAGHVPSYPHAYLPRVDLRAISAPLALCRPTRLVDLLRGIRCRRLHTCGALQPHRPASGLCPPAAIRRVLEWQSTPILVTYHTQPDALGAVRFHLHLRNETGRRAHRRPPARRPRAFRPRTFALRPGRSLQPLAHPPRYCECLLPAVHRPQLVHGLPPYPQNRPHLCQIRQTLSL